MRDHARRSGPSPPRFPMLHQYLRLPLLFCFLLAPGADTPSAGAWTWRKGAYYLKLSSSYLATHEERKSLLLNQLTVIGKVSFMYLWSERAEIALLPASSGVAWDRGLRQSLRLQDTLTPVGRGMR